MKNKESITWEKSFEGRGDILENTGWFRLVRRPQLGTVCKHSAVVRAPSAPDESREALGQFRGRLRPSILESD